MTVVTLTSDFGTADGYVGAMKGVVLSLARDAVLVDIAHDVPRHDVAAGAFTLAQAAPLFPAGTVHVAVVDPGVGGPRRDLLLESGGAYYVGPDNGLLSLAAREPRVVRAIEAQPFRRASVSPTFHGRDVFAQTAGCLAAGADPTGAGPILGSMKVLEGLPGTGDAASPSVILHVDSFGNLITSWPADALPAVKFWVEPEGRPAFELLPARTYQDVSPGELVAYVGSAGLIELAVREGSAAQRTGLTRGARLSMRRSQ